VGSKVVKEAPNTALTAAKNLPEIILEKVGY